MPRQAMRKRTTRNAATRIAMRRRRATHSDDGGHGSPSGHQGGCLLRPDRFRFLQGGPPPPFGSVEVIVEPVADAVHGQEIVRMSGIGFELAADVLDVGVNCALI